MHNVYVYDILFHDSIFTLYFYIYFEKLEKSKKYIVLVNFNLFNIFLFLFNFFICQENLENHKKIKIQRKNTKKIKNYIC